MILKQNSNGKFQNFETVVEEFCIQEDVLWLIGLKKWILSAVHKIGKTKKFVNVSFNELAKEPISGLIRAVVTAFLCWPSTRWPNTKSRFWQRRKIWSEFWFWRAILGFRSRFWGFEMSILGFRSWFFEDAIFGFLGFKVLSARFQILKRVFRARLL